MESMGGGGEHGGDGEDGGDREDGGMEGDREGRSRGIKGWRDKGSLWFGIIELGTMSELEFTTGRRNTHPIIFCQLEKHGPPRIKTLDIWTADLGGGSARMVRGWHEMA